MDMRITRTSDVHEVVFHVDGQLCRENVDELTRELESIDGPVALELSGLQSVDNDGIAILLGVAASGVDLRGVSPYIELLLKRKT